MPHAPARRVRQARLHLNSNRVPNGQDRPTPRLQSLGLRQSFAGEVSRRMIASMKQCPFAHLQLLCYCWQILQSPAFPHGAYQGGIDSDWRHENGRIYHGHCSRLIVRAGPKSLQLMKSTHRDCSDGHVTTVPHSCSHAVRNVQSSHTAALVSSRGSGVKRRYGLTMVILGKSFSASWPLIVGCTITSSPGICQHASWTLRHTRELTRQPVDRSGDLVLVACLERIDDAEDLGGVATGAGGVGEDSADGLLGVDDEDGADGESNALLIDVGGVLVVDPATPHISRCPKVYAEQCILTYRRAARSSSPCRR